MNTIDRIHHLISILAAGACALLAFAAAAPTALASQLRPDPPWWIGHRALPVHPPLPRGHVTGPVPVYQVPARTAVTGGMPGWQIALIAAAAALAAAAVAVLLDRAGAARRKPRTQRAVVIPVALILAAAAVAGTIGAFRADHRPAGERPAVVARIRVAGTPSFIAAGQHAIWVLSAATLYRIDPQTDRVAGAVRIPGGQYGDVAVTHDAVWVMSAGTGWLSRIDPETVRVVGAVRITGQRNPGGDSPVAVTHDAVWVAVFGESGANGKVHGGSLVRVDPGTMQVAARLPISGIVALEPGMGSLWANQIGAYPSPPRQDRLKGSVDRVDPSTDEVHAVLTGASLSIRMVVAGGFVWVYDQQSRAIERVDPRTGSVSRIGSQPVSIGGGDVTDSLAYADGALWFPDCGPDGCPDTGPLSVRRLDISTGALSTIPLGISGTIENTASGHIERNVGLHVIAADANSVWLMVENQTWKGNRGEYWGGRLIRMEISTRRVQAVTIGAYDLSGLIADGDLWLADYQHHSVLRVDP